MAGIGKTAVAREFARLLNCASPKDYDGCDECGSCRKLDSGTHPDVVWVAREGTYIKLDQIRGLRERMRFRPFEGKWRVTIIQDAQDLKEEAGNALLKLLEEPPRQNIFLLTALEPQMLLPTIVSRCCHVRFQPLEDILIEDHLVKECGIPHGQAREVARLAEGSLERAHQLIEGDRIAYWKEIIGNISRLGELPMIDFFPFMSQWAQKSDDLEQDLECIKLWIRDLILTRFIAGYRPVIRTDVEVPGRSRDISVESLFRLYKKIEEALQNLRQNANRQFTLEALCLAIKDGLYGQGCWNSFSQGG